MPAYIHHHDDIEPAFVICPSCVGLPMFVRDVEPHWSMAKIDFTYECSDCGAEIKQTVVKPQCGIDLVGWAKARLRRAHHLYSGWKMVGTLRFAHPTKFEINLPHHARPALARIPAPRDPIPASAAAS